MHAPHNKLRKITLDSLFCLQQVREYYRRFPTAEVTEAESDEHWLKEEPRVEFTGGWHVRYPTSVLLNTRRTWLTSTSIGVAVYGAVFGAGLICLVQSAGLICLAGISLHLVSIWFSIPCNHALGATNMDASHVHRSAAVLAVAAGEEGLGRYLDLHPHFLAFINAKWGNKEMAYFEYVTGLVTHLQAVAKPAKLQASYRCACSGPAWCEVG